MEHIVVRTIRKNNVDNIVTIIFYCSENKVVPMKYKWLTLIF